MGHLDVWEKRVGGKGVLWVQRSWGRIAFDLQCNRRESRVPWLVGAGSRGDQRSKRPSPREVSEAVPRIWSSSQ